MIALLLVVSVIPPALMVGGPSGTPDGPIFQATRPIRIFILAGQSNAVGYNNTTELREDKIHFDERLSQLRVLFWPGSNARAGFADQWIKLRAGVSDISDREPFRDGCFGPEIGFALSLSHALPDEEIAIIKYAVGATGIARSEDYDDYIPSLTGFDDKGRNWYPGSKGKSPGMLYEDLLMNVRSALDALEKQGRKYQIAGFMWMQGEHEAGISKKMAGDYDELLTLFRNSVRKDLKSKDLPFVIGEVNSHTWAFADIGRRSQLEACRHDPKTFLVKTTDLSRKGIGGLAHFEADAMLELGDRFAKGMLRLLSNGDGG